MSIPEITQKLLAAKKEKGLTFANLEKIVRRDEVWQATVLYERSPLRYCSNSSLTHGFKPWDCEE